MKVEIFTLCDFASADAGGKLNVIGSFDHIWAMQVPVVWPLCALAAKMRFQMVEQGTKKIRISFIDADGTSVMPTLEAPIVVQFQPGESTATVPFVMIMQQIKLPHFGEYSIDLAIDGTQQASIPLIARQVRLPPAAQIQSAEKPPE
jgi:hypothetical protein